MGFGWARWRLESLKLFLCLGLLVPTTVVSMNYHGRFIRDDKVRSWCHIKVATVLVIDCPDASPHNIIIARCYITTVNLQLP